MSRYSYLSEFFSEKITDEVINGHELNYELLDNITQNSDYIYPEININNRIADLETKCDNVVLKILCDQLNNLSFDRLYLNPNNHFIVLYRKNNVNRISSELIASKHNKWRYGNRCNNYKFNTFYFQDKDKFSIEKKINEMKILKEYYRNYDWDDVYCYENFTFNPHIDFKKYLKGDTPTIKNNPIKTPISYEKIILNFNELKEYIIFNYGEYYDITGN